MDLACELGKWWDYYNSVYLERALRPPVLRVVETAVLGRFDAATRTLTISAGHLDRDPWLGVMETLRHEMAHQYVAEVLGSAGEPPHGSRFREACRLLRVSPRACGAGTEVTHDTASGPARSAILDRVHKLLSLSSSPNEHEAELALRKARELLLRHNIADSELARDRAFGVRRLGPARTRRAAWELWLASILAEFFFVRTIWVPAFDVATRRDVSVLEVYGTAENLAMADYVYGYLTHVLDDLALRYAERAGALGARERERYFAGVLKSFRDQLRAQEQRLETEHALVWRGDPALEEFWRWHNPRVRTTRGAGLLRTPAYEDGLRDGKKITLRKPVRGEPGGFGGYLTG